MTAIRQLLAHVRLGDPQSHAGLTMFPLLDGGGREPPYLALRQALALGTVAIEEVSEAGSVPNLAVRNDLDLFDAPATLGVVFPKLVNSWALDAIEPRPGGGARPAVTRAEALLAAIAVAEEWESPAVGLGREVRLQHEGLTAAALVHDDTVIHLTAFEQDE